MRLHLDIDAYFVSAERSRNARLKGKPVVVSSFNNGDFFSEKASEYSIILAKSYEAKACGVKTAMLTNDALKLCPKAINVACDHAFYRALSRKLRKYLHTQLAVIERFSIDEFFAELRGQVEDKDAYEFAKTLQENVAKIFDLPISVGVSDSKWGAKFLTTMAKPFGVLCLNKDELLKRFGDEDIALFTGIGKHMLKELNINGVYKIRDVGPNKDVFNSLGKAGRKTYERILGIDNEEVSESSRKSLGIGRSFAPIYDQKELLRRLSVLNRHLAFEFGDLNLTPSSYSISLVYKDNTRVSKSCSHFEDFSEEGAFLVFKQLFCSCKQGGVKSMSITLAKFGKQRALGLYCDANKSKLARSLQHLRNKYGVEIIKKAKELEV